MENYFSQHTSGQFNEELEEIRTALMEMGGMVESQVSKAVRAIVNSDADLANEVIAGEQEIDEKELYLDDCCAKVILKRQPTASDLRLVLSVSRVTRDLERAADEAYRIALYALELMEGNQAHTNICRQSMRYMGQEVTGMISSALNAFTRGDVDEALDVVNNDKLVDSQYGSALRELITYMMEDPRSISQAVSAIWILRAIERIGDHTRNIGEQVVYLVSGEDMRHQTANENRAEATQKAEN